LKIENRVFDFQDDDCKFMRRMKPDNKTGLSKRQLFYILQKISPENKKDGLQKLSNIFTIVGTVVTIFLTLYISKQQTEIKHLGDVIFELKQQNQSGKVQIGELAAQTKLLQQQQQLSEKSNLALFKQLNILETEKSVIQTKDFQQIVELSTHLRDELLLIQAIDSTTFVKQLSEQQQRSIFQRIEGLIKKGLANNYIVSKDSIYSSWYIFSQQLSFTDWKFSSANPYTSNFYLNGQKISKALHLEIAYNRFVLYFNTFYYKGVNRLLNSREFRREVVKRRLQTDFGRPDSNAVGKNLW
jgi:hypothetical protein